MKTFRDLYIELNGIDIEEFIEKLTLHCKPPWFRNYDKEDNLRSPGEKVYCFEREKRDEVPSAALFLFMKTEDVWYVSNIVPISTLELNYDQYNQILEDFLDSLVKPNAKKTALRAKITSDEVSISTVAGNEVEAALVRFSNLANKSTGSSHPADRQRWFDFLILANQADSKLGPDFIVRSLVELGWTQEQAYELGVQFEFGDDLLSYFRER